MRYGKSFAGGLTLLFFVTGAGGGWGYFSDTPVNVERQYILDPGQSQICGHDFTVDNFGDEQAQYTVVAGGVTYDNRKLPAHGNRFYALHKGNGDPARKEDAKILNADSAVVANSGQGGKLRLTCKAE